MPPTRASRSESFCYFSTGCFSPPIALRLSIPRRLMTMRRSTPMPRLAFPLALALLGLGLAGCENTKEMLGLTKRSPDEFQVVSRAPLSMPPDYSLRPPTPGAARPQEGTVQQQAEGIVTGHADRNVSTLQPDQIPSIGEGEAPQAAESAG